MCLGGGGSGNAAARQAAEQEAEARRREEERAARIAQGRQLVKQQFRTFDNDFYKRFRQANLDSTLPELERQFQDAREQMIYALARAGLTNSTAAADKQGDLMRLYDTERGAIVNRAKQAVNNLRSDVENERATSLMQLEAANDPIAAANAATGRVQALSQRPIEYSPLGDVFAGLAEGIGGFVKGLRERRLLDEIRAGAASPQGVRNAARVVG